MSSWANCIQQDLPPSWSEGLTTATNLVDFLDLIRYKLMHYNCILLHIVIITYSSYMWSSWSSNSGYIMLIDIMCWLLVIVLNYYTCGLNGNYGLLIDLIYGFGSKPWYCTLVKPKIAEIYGCLLPKNMVFLRFWSIPILAVLIHPHENNMEKSHEQRFSRPCDTNNILWAD